MARQRVWITRTAPGAERTAQAVRAAGFEPLVSPLLIANPLFATPDIGSLDNVAALAFTSVNGLAFADLSPRRDWLVFAVGDRTAQAARDRGFTDVVSAGGDANELARLIARQWIARGWTDRPDILLVPTAAQPAADLAALMEGDVSVRTIAVYEMQESPAAPPADFDIVLIHSARAADILARRLKPAVAGRCVAVALSETAATPLRALGFADLRIAARPDEPGLIAALGKAPPAV
ncbi:uroporphyrinogen-III synthase [soil metagenome]